MKSILWVVLLSAVFLTGACAADGKVQLRLTSLDIGASGILPVGTYSDYSDYGAGGTIRLSTSLLPSRFDFSFRLGAFWLDNENPYTDLVLNFHSLLEVAYRISLGNSSWVLSPRISGGVLVHYASGDFNTLEGRTQKVYVDQLYGASLDISFEPWLSRNPNARFGFYIAPSYFIFPNQNDFGMYGSLDIGGRIRLGNPGNVNRGSEA